MNKQNIWYWNEANPYELIAFESTAQPESNSMVQDINIHYHWSLLFSGRNWQCTYCDIWPIYDYGEWVLVSRVTPSWHWPCHCLVPIRWSNSTYWSAVDEHFKGCIWTLNNFPLWWHFLASPFALCVGLWFLFIGLLEKWSVSNTSSRLK